MSPSTIGEFSILNLTIPAISSLPEQTSHTIYMRPHAPKIPTENDSRSLFLVNVPVDSTPSHLRTVFASLIGAGRFESVSFEHEILGNDSIAGPSFNTQISKKRKLAADSHEESTIDMPSIWDRKLRKSGSSAVVLLVDNKSVEKTLRAIRRLHKHDKKSLDSHISWPVWGDGISIPVPPLGSARYLTHHRLRFPDKHELQLNIESFITDFHTREEAQHERGKRLKNVADADGFVTVTRGGRVAPARRDLVEQKMALMEEREKKKRENMRESGFYRFQGREKRKEEAEELVRRFEEDRKKVQALRESKGRSGFKPES